MHAQLDTCVSDDSKKKEIIIIYATYLLHCIV